MMPQRRRGEKAKETKVIPVQPKRVSFPSLELELDTVSKFDEYHDEFATQREDEMVELDGGGGGGGVGGSEMVAFDFIADIDFGERGKVDEILRASALDDNGGLYGGGSAVRSRARDRDPESFLIEAEEDDNDSDDDGGGAAAGGHGNGSGAAFHSGMNSRGGVCFTDPGMNVVERKFLVLTKKFAEFRAKSHGLQGRYRAVFERNRELRASLERSRRELADAKKEVGEQAEELHQRRLGLGAGGKGGSGFANVQGNQAAAAAERRRKREEQRRRMYLDATNDGGDLEDESAAHGDENCFELAMRRAMKWVRRHWPVSSSSLSESESACIESIRVHQRVDEHLPACMHTPWRAFALARRCTRVRAMFAQCPRTGGRSRPRWQRLPPACAARAAL